MKPITLVQLFDDLQLQMLDEIVQSVAHVPFHRFCLDSRKVSEGDAFVLLSSFSHQDDALERANQYLTSVEDEAAFVLSQIDPKLLDVRFSKPIVYLPTIRHYLGI